MSISICIKRLELLDRKSQRTTIPVLAERAAKGDKITQRALDILRSVRFSPNRRGRQRDLDGAGLYPTTDEDPTVFGVKDGGITKRKGLELLQGLGLSQKAAASLVDAEATDNITLGSILTQILGGTRDALQDVIDLPAGILNVITEFISPDAPGGPRRRVVHEVESPIKLPDVPEGEATTERVTRLLSRIAIEMLPVGGIASKAMRGTKAGKQALDALQKRMLQAMSGVDDVRDLSKRGVIRLLEDIDDVKRANVDAVVDANLEAIRKVARRRLDKLEGIDTSKLADDVIDIDQGAVRHVDDAATTGSDVVQPLSESARRISQILDLPFRPQDFAKMDLRQAIATRQRILSRLPDMDIERESGPILELLRAVEAQIQRLQ